VPQDKLEIVRSACPLTVIGEVIEEGVLIEIASGIEELKCLGYDHFKEKN